MLQPKNLHGTSCALLLIDDTGDGLARSLVVIGTVLLVNGELYFEKDLLQGFPVPASWQDRLYPTPAEQTDLLRGCSHFIAIPRSEAEQLLEVFNIESRWGAWCPVEPFTQDEQR